MSFPQKSTNETVNYGSNGEFTEIFEYSESKKFIPLSLFSDLMGVIKSIDMKLPIWKLIKEKYKFTPLLEL